MKLNHEIIDEWWNLKTQIKKIRIKWKWKYTLSEPLRNSKSRTGFSSVAQGLWEALVPKQETGKAEGSSWLGMLTLLEPERAQWRSSKTQKNRLCVKAADGSKEQNKMNIWARKTQRNDLLGNNMIDTLSQSNQQRKQKLMRPTKWGLVRMKAWPPYLAGYGILLNKAEVMAIVHKCTVTDLYICNG